MEKYRDGNNRTKRVRDAQSVIGFLANRFNTAPTRSDHFQQPVLDGQTYQPSPHDIEDTQQGFDSEGNYHHPSLRTEHIERPVQLDGLWRLYD